MKVVARRMYPLLAALILFAVSPLSAQSPAEGVADAPARATEPVADPAAVVKAGHARFTVLTPELVRMEWAADDRFEDHPSFVFLNRRLPVPQFTKKLSGNAVMIDTGKLQLVYRRTGEAAGFTAANHASAERQGCYMAPRNALGRKSSGNDAYVGRRAGRRAPQRAHRRGTDLAGRMGLGE